MDDKYLDKIRSAHGAIKAVNIITWIMIVAGGGLALAGFVAGWYKKNSHETTSITVKPDKLKTIQSTVAPLDLNLPPKY